MLGRFGAVAGLAFDIARILIFRKWDDERDDEKPRGDDGPAPVVRVTPAAAEMVARAAPPRQVTPAEDEPLEGSVEARRNRTRWE